MFTHNNRPLNGVFDEGVGVHNDGQAKLTLTVLAQVCVWHLVTCGLHGVYVFGLCVCECDE